MKCPTCNKDRPAATPATAHKKGQGRYCSTKCSGVAGGKAYMAQRARKREEGVDNPWEMTKRNSVQKLIKTGDVEFLAKLGWTKEEAARKMAAYELDNRLNNQAMEKWHAWITREV